MKDTNVTHQAKRGVRRTIAELQDLLFRGAVNIYLRPRLVPDVLVDDGGKLVEAAVVFDAALHPGVASFR